MLRDLVALARPKHYLKNGLVFVPLVFSGRMFTDGNLATVLLATIAFCAVASMVYIINDICDTDRDRLHPKKKFRPIASGSVSVGQAAMLTVALGLAAILFGIDAGLPPVGWMLLTGYLVINIAYNAGFKNIPIVDIAILSAGFVIRVLYGGAAVDVEVSRWLYLTVLSGAFYMGLGKRRGELLVNGTKSRKVNEVYTHNFLDKNMYVCLALTLVFYSLWATDPMRSGRSLFWTIPLAFLLLMTYSLDIEKGGSMGDPVDVLLSNRVLAIFGLAYIILTTCLLYA